MLTLALFVNYFFITTKFKIIISPNILNNIIISIVIKFNLLIINNKKVIIINIFKALLVVKFTKITIIIYLYLKLIKKLIITFFYNKYFIKLYK